MKKSQKIKQYNTSYSAARDVPKHSQTRMRDSGACALVKTSGVKYTVVFLVIKLLVQNVH